MESHLNWQSANVKIPLSNNNVKTIECRLEAVFIRGPLAEVFSEDM